MSSVLVITGLVGQERIDPLRKSLADCLETIGTVIDQHPDGDRYYSEIAPTLRAQAGSGGCFRVKLPDGDLRPLSATEYENLMGWEPDCTSRGINGPDGREILISRSRRQQICANGIIPPEIADICSNLKRFHR